MKKHLNITLLSMALFSIVGFTFQVAAMEKTSYQNTVDLAAEVYRTALIEHHGDLQAIQSNRDTMNLLEISREALHRMVLSRELVADENIFDGAFYLLMEINRIMGPRALSIRPPAYFINNKTS